MRNFLDILKWIPAGFKFVGAMIPLIKGLIEGFETPGHGEEKKKAVLDALAKIIDKAEAPDSVRKLALWAADFLIDAIVAIKNAVGEFYHPQPA